eukprot:scaffold22661_cov157-Skeletonema_dohrnii-CCMP3373.AAC.6
MTIAAAAEEEEYEAPVDFGDAAHSRGMATSATTSVASSSRILRTPASAPAFSGDNKKSAAAAANSSIKSDQLIASKHQRSKPSKLNATGLPEDGNNSFHSSPQLMQNNNSSTPQRIQQSSSRRDLEQKLRYRSNRDRNNATFPHRSGNNMQRNDMSNTKNDDVRENNNNNASSAPLPKALTDLLLQTAILGIDTTAKLSKPTLALTKNTLLPQIILPLLTELWETYAPDRLQTWMKVLPSSLKNVHDLLWETNAGKQFGQTSFQLGEDVVDMISSEVARQYCIDVTVVLIKFMDALHTPEVRKLLDQFAISMCRLVDVMSSGKAKQIWFDVSDTIWAALEVGSDDVMVMALAEGCAKVCFALERERESLKRRKRGGVGGDGSDEVGRSGKVKTERLIAASRRRKERDQRQMETYPPGKEVLRGEGGRADIEDALMDGLGSFTRDDDQQQREDDNVLDDADQIYINMSSIVDNNDRPPQRVIVHTTSMEDHPQPFPDPNSVLDRDDESEITTEIEDLRRNDRVVEQCNDLRPQSSSASTQMTDNRHQQEGALVYEDERGNPLDNDALSKYDDVDDEQDGVSEQYDNFDEPVLQFYRRLNDVLTQTRKETNLREALEKKQNDASSKRAGYANVQHDDRSIEPINQEKDADQSASHALFSISKKSWKLLFVVMICGTLTMCLLWAALGCYGFYMLFIAETHAPLTAAQVQPIVIQIASTSNQGLNNACTLETDQSDRHDVASISLDDWKELKHDVDAAIDLINSE